MIWLRSIFTIGKGFFSKYLAGIIVVTVSGLFAAHYVQVGYLKKTVAMQAGHLKQIQSQLIQARGTLNMQNLAVNDLLVEAEAAALHNEKVAAVNQQRQKRAEQTETKSRRRLQAALADSDCANAPPPQNIKDEF